MDVVRIRGTSLPAVGPGTSARTRCMELSFSIGMTISTKTSTPIPPTQWVKHLQNATPCPSVPGSARTDAPVVVKPDTISNNAPQ